MVRPWLFLVWTGCAVGYPGPEAHERGGPLWEDVGACTAEFEPNDGGDEAEFHFLGVPGFQQPARVCGSVSSTGITDENLLTGDLDFYIFELLDEAWVTVQLDPDRGDPHLFIATYDAFESRRWDGWMEPGMHAVRVASEAGQTGTYRLEIRAE